MKGDNKVSGPFIYSRPRAGRRTVALLALGAFGAGMVADRIIHTIDPSPFNGSSMEATRVQIKDISGQPVEADFLVHVHTLGSVTLRDMKQEVEQRIATDSLVGYHEPPGVYAYRPDCFDSRNRPLDTKVTVADLACSFVLWDKSGPPPADN